MMARAVVIGAGVVAAAWELVVAAWQLEAGVEAGVEVTWIAKARSPG